MRPPAKVLIPEGAFGATFAIQTSAVSAATRVVIHTGTFGDGYQAPEAWLTVKPAGSAASAPTLAGVSLRSTHHRQWWDYHRHGDAQRAGAGRWRVRVGQRQHGRTGRHLAARRRDRACRKPHRGLHDHGALRSTRSQWVMIQASYGSGANGMHGALLQIDPAPGHAGGLRDRDRSDVGDVGADRSRNGGPRAAGAAGGATVFLSSSDPAAQVPSSVNIAAGNSANSFTITTSSVINVDLGKHRGPTSGTDTTKDDVADDLSGSQCRRRAVVRVAQRQWHDRRQQHSGNALPQR